MTNERLPISLIIPCRNEAQNLELLLPAVTGLAEEVLIVDGNSTDHTRQLAEKYGVGFILDDGRGKGAAVRLGIERASRNVIVLMDADMSHDPRDILALAKPILDDQADLVLGSRMHGGSDEFVATTNEVVRLFGNIGLTWLINLRCGSKLSDSQNGFRAARTSLLRSLRLTSRKHTIELEMIMRALRAGVRVIEVAAHESARRFGTSQLSVWKQGWLFFLIYVRECVRPL